MKSKVSGFQHRHECDIHEEWTPCCHNQWVKPAMTDLTGEHSLNLKLQDRIKDWMWARFCSVKIEMWLLEFVPQVLKGLRKHSCLQTKSLLQLTHTMSRACKTGQELKSGTLGNEKIKCRTIRFLIRTVCGLGPCTDSTRHCQATQLLQCFEIPCFHWQFS